MGKVSREMGIWWGEEGQIPDPTRLYHKIKKKKDSKNNILTQAVDCSMHGTL